MYIYIYAPPRELRTLPKEFTAAARIKHTDIIIWSVKAKKVFVIELSVPYEENFDWPHQRKLEKYEDLRE